MKHNIKIFSYIFRSHTLFCSIVSGNIYSDKEMRIKKNIFINTGTNNINTCIIPYWNNLNIVNSCSLIGIRCLKSSVVINNTFNLQNQV